MWIVTNRELHIHLCTYHKLHKYIVNIKIINSDVITFIFTFSYTNILLLFVSWLGKSKTIAFYSAIFECFFYKMSTNWTKIKIFSYIIVIFLAGSSNLNFHRKLVVWSSSIYSINHWMLVYCSRHLFITLHYTL